MSDGPHMTPMPPSESDLIVDRLMYISYASSREATPHIPAASFAKHYPNAANLEARYQTELALAKAKASAASTCRNMESK